MAKATLRPMLDHAKVLVLTIFFGIIAFTAYFVDMIKKGPRRLFYVKQRNTRPDILDGNDYGAHEFIRQALR